MLARLAKISRPVIKPIRAASTDIIDITQGLEFCGEETDQLLELQSVAYDFAQNELAPNRASWDKHHTPMPDELWKKCADMGFGGIYCPEDIGGMGLSRLATSVVFETLSTGCVSTTALLTIHNMCNWMIRNFGNEAQAEKYCHQLSVFEKIASYCLTEPGNGSDAANLQTKAVLSDCGKFYKLSGEKVFISNAGRSDIYIVMCRTGKPGPKGISTLIVEKGMEGLSFGGLEDKLGWNSQPTRSVVFDDVMVPVENRIGEEGQGFNFAMAGLNGGRINIASCSLGGAYECLKLSRNYATGRKQFGKSITEFQNTEFKLAEMAGRLISSRLLVRQAAMSLDAKNPAAAQMCALAKMEATEKCQTVIDDALQLYGGYGYLKDYPVQQFYRDCRVHMILEGTNQIMRMLVGRNVVAHADA